MRIRRAVHSDLAGIREIEDECFGTERFPLSWFKSYLRRAGPAFLLAEDGRRPAGYAVGIVDARFRPPRARLESIAVRKAWRKQGLGRRLLEGFEREVSRLGAASVTLEVEETNAAARRLYVQAGYRAEGALPDYYGHGRHGVRFVKAL